MTIDHVHAQTFANLPAQFRITPHDHLSQCRVLREAALVVGQMRFVPHLRVHAVMRHFAWTTQGWREAAGQIMRLLVVPLGHALDQLPIGNSGRCSISQFQAMPVRPDMAQAVATACRETPGV